MSVVAYISTRDYKWCQKTIYDETLIKKKFRNHDLKRKKNVKHSCIKTLVYTNVL